MNKLKKFRIKIGFLLSCLIFCFLQIPLYAEENAETNVSSPVTIIDMGMKPAVKMQESTLDYENPYNTYETLKVPTQITKQGDYYFIVDCYHNQVIYTKNMGIPLKQWKVMTNDVTLPHAIASDGNFYLVADTEKNRILVFEWKNGRFQNTQRLDDIGIRPHYIQYDKETDSFFVWSSMTGDMYILNKAPDTETLCIREVRHIKELGNYYVRSFTIDGNQIIFPSGTNRYMMIVNKNTFEVLGRYPVTSEISGMAYVLPIGSYYYMTVSCDANANQDAATFIRTNDLNGLAQGKYEVMYQYVSNKGIPYYIDHFNDAFYMTNSGVSNNIWRFQVLNDQITGVNAMY